MKSIVSKKILIYSLLLAYLLIPSQCNRTMKTKNETTSKTTEEKTGDFRYSSDIGNCLKKGSAIYDEKTQQYTIEGAGENMWAEKDAFYFLYNKIEGDFILQFEFEFIGKATNEHRKIGWMIRNDTTAGSQYIDGTVHNDGLTALQYRFEQNGLTSEVRSTSQSPDIIQLQRKGNLYTLSTAERGEEFKSVELADSNNVINNEVLVGIFICSHERGVIETARVKNVRIVIPAADDFVPYQDYLASHLEVMDIETGNRTILYTDSASIQAPNWTIDGKSLIYNSGEGLIYNFDIENRKQTQINTGFATNNNNDHVLSFEGKTLGISDASETGVSKIYTVQVEGGTPQQITKLAPSYLHGFSPDGKLMVFTGKRGERDDFEIFAIHRETKKETQLTNSDGLDDGSEYSPDGKYIYFNSVRSGKMQIWRMLADGSKPERITYDEMNNWFPHVSPDGKKIVYIAYGNDVEPADHPFYKHVSIRLMDIETRKITILAHIYGGQGSMNTPNWSPDGKKIAFISNTDLN